MGIISKLTQTIEEKDEVIAEAKTHADNLDFDIIALKQVNENSCMAIEDQL